MDGRFWTIPARLPYERQQVVEIEAITDDRKSTGAEVRAGALKLSRSMRSVAGFVACADARHGPSNPSEKISSVIGALMWIVSR